MYEDSPLLYPGDLNPEDPPTLIWRSRVLTIPPSAPGGVRPFAFDPVIPLCVDGRLPWGQTATNGALERHDGVVPATANVLNVDRQRVYRWLRTGLQADQADVIAIMFGLHPCLVWSDWFTHTPGTDEEVTTFEAIRPRTEVPVGWLETERRLVELRDQGFLMREMAHTLMDEKRLTRGGSKIWNHQKVKDAFRHISPLRVSA